MNVRKFTRCLPKRNLQLQMQKKSREASGTLDYEQSLSFLKSVKQNARRKWPRAWLMAMERHKERETTHKARENGLSRSSDFLAWKLKCWQARHVKRDLRVRLRAVSLFFFFLLGMPPSFLASRGFAAQRSSACALPSLNLKKKRDRSQSSKHENSSLLKNFVSTSWKSILKSGNPYFCSHIS